MPNTLTDPLSKASREVKELLKPAQYLLSTVNSEVHGSACTPSNCDGCRVLAREAIDSLRQAADVLNEAIEQ